MAVTVTAVKAVGYNTRSWTIIMDQDADVTTGNIAHGLPFTPDWYVLTPLNEDFFTGSYHIDTVDATNVVVHKTNAAGSGNAAPACLLTVGRLHTTMM